MAPACGRHLFSVHRRAAPEVLPAHELSDEDHLRKSRTASSASTPPVILIGRNGALAATSALVIMI